MVRTCSLNCLSSRSPCQTPHSLNAPPSPSQVSALILGKTDPHYDKLSLAGLAERGPKIGLLGHVKWSLSAVRDAQHKFLQHEGAHTELHGSYRSTLRLR